MFNKMLAAATTDEEKGALEESRDEVLSAPKMTIEFTADGKMITVIPDGAGTSRDAGTYEVKSEDADSSRANRE